MSKKIKTVSQPDLPAVGAPAKAQEPVFDRALAKSVPAYRHTPTARTVAYHQADGEHVRLFSATGTYIATTATADASQL